MASGGYDGSGIYKHYKGGDYYAFGTALNTDDEDTRTYVVYTSMKQDDDESICWIRELDDFNAEVEHEGKLVPRFVKQIEYVNRHGV